MTTPVAYTLTRRRWTASTSFGWLSGIFFVVLLSGVFDWAGVEGFQFYTGMGMAGGVGLFQWLRLRRYDIGPSWVFSGVAGFGLAFLSYDLVARFTSFTLGDLFLPVCVPLGAATTGLTQVALLHMRGKQAWRWTAMSVLAWSMATLLVVLVSYTRAIAPHPLTGFFVNLTLILSGGPVLGATTFNSVASWLPVRMLEEHPR